MMNIILQKSLFLTKNVMTFFLLLTLSLSCLKSETEHIPLQKFVTPQKKTLLLKVAATKPLQEKGLSGIKPHELQMNEGMLFQYDSDDFRTFWMPDTYLDLGLLYLDKEYRIIEKGLLTAHPGWEEPIPRGTTVYCRHVIELPANSPLFKELAIGEQLSPLDGTPEKKE